MGRAEDAPKGEKQYIDVLHKQIQLLEQESQVSEETLIKLKRDLEAVKEEHVFEDIQELTERLKFLSEKLDFDHRDLDLSGVKEELKKAEDEWDRNLPDDPADLVNNND